MLGLLGTTLRVFVDRPLGSRHPRHADLVYTLNYGFVPGTTTPDGSATNAYIMGLEVPLETFEGYSIAVIQRADEAEDKLVAPPLGLDYSCEEIRAAT